MDEQKITKEHNLEEDPYYILLPKKEAHYLLKEYWKENKGNYAFFHQYDEGVMLSYVTQYQTLDAEPLSKLVDVNGKPPEKKYSIAFTLSGAEGCCYLSRDTLSELISLINSPTPIVDDHKNTRLLQLVNHMDNKNNFANISKETISFLTKDILTPYIQRLPQWIPSLTDKLFLQHPCYCGGLSADEAEKVLKVLAKKNEGIKIKFLIIRSSSSEDNIAISFVTDENTYGSNRLPVSAAGIITQANKPFQNLDDLIKNMGARGYTVLRKDTVLSALKYQYGQFWSCATENPFASQASQHHASPPQEVSPNNTSNSF